MWPFDYLAAGLGGLSSLSSWKWDHTRLWPALTRRRDLILGLVLGISLSLSSTSAALWLQQYRRKLAIRRMPPRPIELRSEEVGDGVVGLIGNTPLIRINSLSDALGVEILFLNPGGSVKDRVALKIITDAEEAGLLYPHTGSVLFEGTVGSTGISLATVGRAKGYECCIIMPDDVAVEKVQVLEKLGARVERVRPASYVDEKQFVNLARRRAQEFGRTTINEPDVVLTRRVRFREPSFSSTSSSPTVPNAGNGNGNADADTEADLKVDLLSTRRPRGFFADQFENESNFYAHYAGTGPEILRQLAGRVDAFISGAGTGGTVSGVGRYLKEHVPEVRVVLADPEGIGSLDKAELQGSGLYNKVKYNVMYDQRESEGTKRRHQVDTVVEGIGINRITRNFSKGFDIIDDAYRITDVEAVAMSRWLVSHDGLYLGSSSACNLVAAVRLVRAGGLSKGARIVTILCVARAPAVNVGRLLMLAPMLTLMLTTSLTPVLTPRCDSGSRHQSKFWSDEYLTEQGIEIKEDIIADMLQL